MEDGAAPFNSGPDCPRQNWLQSFSLVVPGGIIGVVQNAFYLAPQRKLESAQLSRHHPIVHPGFEESGPLTLENVLPVGRNSIDIANESLDRALDRIFAQDTLTSDDIDRAWSNRVERLRFPFSQRLASRISEYTPFSLVTFDAHAWVAFKKESEFAESTSCDNAVLVPFGDNRVPDTFGGFRRNDHGEVFEYLDEFRNITSSMPPSYFGEPSLVTAGEAFPIEGIEPWIGSLIVSVLSTGMHLLYSEGRRFAQCWHYGVKAISEAEFWDVIFREAFRV